MGFFYDLTRRISLIRKWSTTLQLKIESARNFIYQLGHGVSGSAIQKLLKSESWTPTAVCLSRTIAVALQSDAF